MNHLEGTSRFTLRSATGNQQGYVEAIYLAQHSTPGASGTTLTEDVTLLVQSDVSSARIAFDPCVGDTADEALDRLACRLERIALAIRNRKAGKLPAS